MHKLRSVNTYFWDDAYIGNLDPIEKLIFLYLLTNPLTNLAGVYEISIRKIAFDTGIDKDMVTKILSRFEKDNKAYYHENHIYLINFQKNQKYTPKMLINVYSILKGLPIKNFMFYVNLIKSLKIELLVPEGYDIDSLSIPYGYDMHKMKGKNEVEVEDEGEVEEEVPPPAKEKKYLDQSFELWRQIFLSNPGMVERDFTNTLVEKFGFKKAKRILYELREKNFKAVSTMKSAIDDKGNIKPKENGNGFNNTSNGSKNNGADPDYLAEIATRRAIRQNKHLQTE